MFAKLKEGLRKAATTTYDALCNEIGRITTALGPKECQNYLTNSGYACE